MGRPRDRRVKALVVLVVAFVFAGLLWRSAFSPTTTETRIVGNAQATVTRTETAANGLLIAAAIVVAGAGAGIFVALMTLAPSGDEGRARRHAWGRGVLAASLVALVASGSALATRGTSRPPSGHGVLSRSSFRTTSAFTTAMKVADLGCAATRPADDERRAVDAIVCSVPWPADIRDGHDDVLVTLWRSPADRDEWLTQNVEDGTRTVVGSGWVATCEFRSTCALIAHRLRTVGG